MAFTRLCGRPPEIARQSRPAVRVAPGTVMAQWPQAGAAANPVPRSPHGPADRIGAMNQLSPQATRAAAGLVKLGRACALAANAATGFLFVLGVPRLQGTVQAIVNPVAIR